MPLAGLPIFHPPPGYRGHMIKCVPEMALESLFSGRLDFL
jgi:hypothetical protein